MYACMHACMFACMCIPGAVHCLLTPTKMQMKHPPPAPLHNFGQSGQSAGAVSSHVPPPPGVP